MSSFKDSVDLWMHTIATFVEIAGVGVILIGGLAATIGFLHAGATGRMREEAFQRYRADLGRAILLGLEFLVAADIIGTIAIKPSFESLGVLALIVAIRTFLSFSLEVEIEGRWPWRRTGNASQ